MGIYPSYICTFACYNILIPSSPCFFVCFAMHASFHTASKFLPQDISSSRIPLVEIMSYRDSTFVPRGHQTYEEIKDLSEKCQHEKEDCLSHPKSGMWPARGKHTPMPPKPWPTSYLLKIRHYLAQLGRLPTCKQYDLQAVIYHTSCTHSIQSITFL